MSRTLGQLRRRAPCLPAALLSSLASLPLENEGHGHPGLLYARRDPLDESSETWIESYRLCYSFSAKSTLFNLVADSLKRDGDQQLAGWVFVGEGAGKQFAADLADSMYGQFKLAFCKAVAGNEKFLDEGTYELAFRSCSQMTGIVLLRSKGLVGSVSAGQQEGLRYEVHEFAFPVTDKKLRHEIRSKLKASTEIVEVDESQVAPAACLPKSSEIVDLISDDEDKDDEMPILTLADVDKASCAPACAMLEDDDEPLIRGVAATVGNGPKDDPGSGQASSQAAAAPALDCGESKDEDGDGLQDASDEASLQISVEQAQEAETALAVSVEGPGKATAVAGTEAESAQCAGIIEAQKEQGCCAPGGVSAAVVESGVVDASPSGANEVAGAVAVQGSGSSYAKLRIGRISCVSSPNLKGQLVVSSEGTPSSSAGERSGCRQGDDVDVGADELAASAAADVPELESHLQAYNEACNAHRMLHHKAQTRLQGPSQVANSSQPTEAGSNCKLFVHNSVLVTVLNRALSRKEPEAVHGIIAGVIRGGKIFMLQAVCVQGQPPCSAPGSGELEAAWLRKQASSLLPDARLLPEDKPQECQGAVMTEDGNGVGDVNDITAEGAAAGQQDSESDVGSMQRLEGGREEESSAMVEDGIVYDTEAANVTENSEAGGRNVDGKGDMKQDKTGVAEAGSTEREHEEPLLRREHDEPREDGVMEKTRAGKVEQKGFPSDTAARGVECVERSADEDWNLLSVVGYFRVAASGAGIEVGEQDVRMLRALNAAGLGLVCAVRDGDEVVSETDFVNFLGFGACAEASSPLQWQVVQEPFLPRRALEECAASAQGIGGGARSAAVALVKSQTSNLRVQEAYMKRQVWLASSMGAGFAGSRSLFHVGGPEMNTNGDDSCQGDNDYSAEYQTSPGAPGWREYTHMDNGRKYYYHPDRGTTTQWEPPKGWFKGKGGKRTASAIATRTHVAATHAATFVPLSTVPSSEAEPDSPEASPRKKSSKSRQKRRPPTCSICRTSGHTCAKCPVVQESLSRNQKCAPIPSVPPGIPPPFPHPQYSFFPLTHQTSYQYNTCFPFQVPKWEVDKRTCHTWQGSANTVGNPFMPPHK